MRLFLSFTVHLENYEIDELVRPKGPLFHRWLPDGQMDALFVQTGDSRQRIKLWFERNGFVDGGFIKYDRARREVDADIMKRQGYLDAGQLWGECEYRRITTNELTPYGKGKKIPRNILQ